MNLTISDINETRKQVTVSIDGDFTRQEEAKVLKEFSKHAKIPGFRPGKAPEKQLRIRYAKQLKDELKTVVARAVYDKLTADESLNLYMIVDFPEMPEIISGEPLALEITVDVNPQFDLPAYQGLKLAVTKTEVSDTEINEAIDRIRAQRADFSVVERAAQTGDYVKISYQGSLEGENLEDLLSEAPRQRAWASVTDGWEEAGTDEAKSYGVPAIIDALPGMQAGDTKAVSQEVPETFPVEQLRGKTLSYELTVHEVRERTLPEIDDAFLKEIRAESLEDLKAQIADDIEGRKKNANENSKREQIIQQLVAAVDFPLPESAIENETQVQMGRIMAHNAQQGVPEEFFEQHKEELYQGASQAAQRDVKLQILLGRIAKEEKIEVTNEDLSMALYNMAMQQREKPEDLAKALRNDRRRLFQLQRQVLFSKTLDKILTSAEVTEQEAESTEKAES